MRELLPIRARGETLALESISLMDCGLRSYT